MLHSNLRCIDQPLFNLCRRHARIQRPYVRCRPADDRCCHGCAILISKAIIQNSTVNMLPRSNNVNIITIITIKTKFILSIFFLLAYSPDNHNMTFYQIIGKHRALFPEFFINSTKPPCTFYIISCESISISVAG